MCSDIMTKNPVCCLTADTVEEVALLMGDEDVGPIPVVENYETKRLVGILTDRDLVLKVVATGRNPSQTTVEEIMTQKPVSCRSADDLQAVLDIMMEHKVRRVPVVDEHDGIVGIISQADVATRIGISQKTGDVVEEISKAEGGHPH
jgi:CBS domain-containing protein